MSGVRASVPAVIETVTPVKATPVGARDLQQQPDVTVPAALALLHPDQHPAAVDGGRRQARDLADAQTRPQAVVNAGRLRNPGTVSRNRNNPTFSDRRPRRHVPYCEAVSFDPQS
jgi:hypothetical protein